MPQHEPLRGDRAFSAVFRRGKRQDGRWLAIRALRNNVGSTRLGFNIGRRVGGAVQRNRIRRRLRHIMAELDPEPGWDLVVIARSDPSAARHRDLMSETAQLLRSAGVQLSGID